MNKMEPQLVINKTDKPNSYEFGNAGNRLKIYFDSVEELVVKIVELKKIGVIDSLTLPQIQF